MAVAPWRIAMASSIGTAHQASALPCQDSHFHLGFTDRAGRPGFVVAVSDGAGSAPGSAVGAMLSCQTFAKLVAAYVEAGGEIARITRPLVTRWISGIVYRLALKAETDDLLLQDYACTLLAAIVSDGAMVFVQVGDGAIVTSTNGSGGWRYVFWPQHGEFANTTNFVTADNALDVVEMASTSEPIDEIALFTDGLENLVLRKAEMAVHAPFFDSMFPSLRRAPGQGVDDSLSQALAGYLATPTVTERTDDDKTLVLATRRGDTE